MPAGAYNIAIEQGTTFTLPITVNMDLTGYTAKMQVREKLADPTSVLDLTTDNGGITLVGGATSTLTLNIPASTTSAMSTFRTGVYDLEITAPNGKVTRLLKGSVVIDPEVTRI